MEFWLAFPLVFLHLLSAIAWAGGVFFYDRVLARGIAAMPEREQRGMWIAFGHRLDRYLTAAGVATIVFGALSGIALGRYQEALGLSSRWGWAIAAGAILAIVALACGKYAGIIALRVLYDDRYWGGDPALGAERDRVLALSARLDRIEVLILPLVIALMALARFS